MQEMQIGNEGNDSASLQKVQYYTKGSQNQQLKIASAKSIYWFIDMAVQSLTWPPSVSTPPPIPYTIEVPTWGRLRSSVSQGFVRCVPSPLFLCRTCCVRTVYALGLLILRMQYTPTHSFWASKWLSPYATRAAVLECQLLFSLYCRNENLPGKCPNWKIWARFIWVGIVHCLIQESRINKSFCQPPWLRKNIAANSSISTYSNELDKKQACKP